MSYELPDVTEDSELKTPTKVMNIEHLRQSLKDRWLSYYEENRSWLTRLGVWVNCEGQRRPSSSFILATLSVLEPQLTQLLPLIVDLSSNPDRIVMALGLNFNPDEQLEAIAQNNGTKEIADSSAKRLPAATNDRLPPRKAVNVHSRMDEACGGVRGDEYPA
ncbi:DUF5331 domain-containing protein [Leptolyngbya sp. FACHB-36]|uniref:DUF5331 domain-containing protein n=1 Tax=Leptolyngbya sp. FACHB-36 TaxID=2692808 RepID=UPI001F553E70|nr:DUF5331 domain-containing protein [Leptolyngbya sp. FACHB-36]